MLSLLALWTFAGLTVALQLQPLHHISNKMPGNFIELALNAQPLVPAVIEGANTFGGGTSSEAMQKLADIFAKEPLAASGKSGGKSEDVLGLDNDPLDIIGIGSDEVDTDALASKVSMLKLEIANAQKTQAGLPAKQAQLTTLEVQLNASLASAASAQSATQAAQQAQVLQQLAQKNAQTSQTLDNQISDLQKQIATLQSQKSALNGSKSSSTESNGTEAGGTGSTSFVEDSAQERHPAKVSSKQQNIGSLLAKSDGKPEHAIKTTHVKHHSSSHKQQQPKQQHRQQQQKKRK